jgi:hypothetical protein
LPNTWLWSNNYTDSKKPALGAGLKLKEMSFCGDNQTLQDRQVTPLPQNCNPSPTPEQQLARRAARAAAHRELYGRNWEYTGDVAKDLALVAKLDAYIRAKRIKRKAPKPPQVVKPRRMPRPASLGLRLTHRRLFAGAASMPRSATMSPSRRSPSFTASA